MSTSPNPAPSSSAPPSAPAKPSNALWWALGIFGLVVFLVIAGGIMTAVYFARSIRVDQKAQKLEVSTPAGKISLHATEGVKTVGLPIYPGAELAESGGGIEFTAPNDQRVGVSAVRYRTNDSLEKVDQWYREQLGSDFERRLPGDRRSEIRIQGVDISKGDIAYVAEANGLIRVVGLKKAFGGTEIGMARIGKQEAQ